MEYKAAGRYVALDEAFRANGNLVELIKVYTDAIEQRNGEWWIVQLLEDIRSLKDNTLTIESTEINKAIKSGLSLPAGTPFALC